jgi:argininosuccinate lyase
MSGLLWQKEGVEVDPRIMRFLAGDDVLLDRELFPYDVQASKAHVEGLARIGLLDTNERDGLLRELDAVGADFAAGRFVLDERYEDGHSAIEARLTERLGDTGRKVHTGRSRNDQVLVASRLWLKAQLSTLIAHCTASARACLDRAAAEALPMPGYTHLQRARSIAISRRSGSALRDFRCRRSMRSSRAASSSSLHSMRSRRRCSICVAWPGI